MSNNSELAVFLTSMQSLYSSAMAPSQQPEKPRDKQHALQLFDAAMRSLHPADVRDAAGDPQPRDAAPPPARPWTGLSARAKFRAVTPDQVSSGVWWVSAPPRAGLAWRAHFQRRHAQPWAPWAGPGARGAPHTEERFRFLWAAGPEGSEGEVLAIALPDRCPSAGNGQHRQAPQGQGWAADHPRAAAAASQAQQIGRSLPALAAGSLLELALPPGPGDPVLVRVWSGRFLLPVDELTGPLVNAVFGAAPWAAARAGSSQ